jgi:hypothetical protein
MYQEAEKLQHKAVSKQEGFVIFNYVTFTDYNPWYTFKTINTSQNTED